LCLHLSQHKKRDRNYEISKTRTINEEEKWCVVPDN
jgi:hypothetical protein